MSVKPYNGNYIVKDVTAEVKSKGGIIIPTSTKNSYKIVEIVEVPENDYYFDHNSVKRKMEFTIGDKVLVHDNVVHDVSAGPYSCLYISNGNILAKIM